jgi:DNA mismatch repair ATPase MutS
LTFHLDRRAVGNDIDANGVRLTMITGANQGGKSTFLRSVGIAQLMMQAGMFVAAEQLSASVATGVYTHFKREEDVSMTHGKLDEELHRMSAIVEQIDSRALLLCNESFASTNEREGSEIARQLIRALRDVGVSTFYVTHLYDLAHGLCEERRDDTLFLRAARGRDGTRPFRVEPAPPLPTSFAGDSYRRIFGKELADARRSTPGGGK